MRVRTKSSPWFGTEGKRGSRMRHVLLGMCCVTLAALCFIFGLVSMQARRNVGHDVALAASNLVSAVAHDVDRNFELLDLSLKAVVASWTDPEIRALSSSLRQRVIFDNSASASDTGTMLVLDRDGIVRASSKDLNPQPDCFADRDYFKVHTTGDDVGLFVSKPFLSRISGKWTVALTRRINNPDGSFGGIALASLKLSYLDKLYASLNLSADDTITLFRTDGTVVTRKPFISEDINKSFRASDSFTQIRMPRAGSFEGPSPVDGVERLISFHRVGALPLIQVVEISAAEAYADWWRKTQIVGTVLGLLCLSSVSLLVLLNMELARRLKVEAVLARLAMTDGLTEVANRRRFDEVLEIEWRTAVRDRTSLSLLMIDADHFKAYNDTFGHQEGDDLLRNIASCIAGHVHRPADLVARYGGEEFVVLLPRTDLAGALAVAEMMRDAVAALAASHPRAATQVATISVGVACIVPAPADRSNKLLTWADGALYQAKFDGRNCCRSAPAFEAEADAA